MFDHIEAFYRPGSVSEAVRLLHGGSGRGEFVAGGTDLVVRADRSIRFLVDITQLGLNCIRKTPEGWVIGATTTMAALESSPGIRALANGILAKAASTCGSVQIRNMATVGGNLANASPSADTATPLLALDSVAVLAESRRRRKIPLVDFFSGPGKTALSTNLPLPMRGGRLAQVSGTQDRGLPRGQRLIVEIVVPAPPGGARVGWSFQKLGRTESDISVVNAAAGLQVDARGNCKWARIALGSVAPTPLRARNAENLLTGSKLNRSAIEEACDEVTREVSPITDVRASADYRREMSRVLAGRALRECAARAGCAL